MNTEIKSAEEMSKIAYPIARNQTDLRIMNKAAMKRAAYAKGYNEAMEAVCVKGKIEQFIEESKNSFTQLVPGKGLNANDWNKIYENSIFLFNQFLDDTLINSNDGNKVCGQTCGCTSPEQCKFPEQKSNDVGDVEKAAKKYAIYNYTKAPNQPVEDSEYVQAVSFHSFKAGVEWQSKNG